MKVLALGDSIVWGQGNRDVDKFVSRVGAWLGAPTPTSLAHSGAVVSPAANDAAPAVWGEVPEGAPSIGAQLGQAVTLLEPASVDVVLVDGGINDVSPYQVAIANPFDPNSEAKLAARTNEIFSGPVRALVDAPKTWLWSGANDPLAPERLERYAAHLLGAPTSFDWPLVTPLASMCHPNVEGSKAYAAAVQACLS